MSIPAMTDTSAIAKSDTTTTTTTTTTTSAPLPLAEVAMRSARHPRISGALQATEFGFASVVPIAYSIGKEVQKTSKKASREVSKSVSNVWEYVKRHPKKVVTVVIVAPAAAFASLHLFGFTSIGPAAGSLAAHGMSYYGAQVPAGGVYALLQSAGMFGWNGMMAVISTSVGLGGAAQYLTAATDDSATCGCAQSFTTSFRENDALLAMMSEYRTLESPVSLRSKL